MIDAVVAFANTNGGDLYLGVENDGHITGNRQVQELFLSREMSQEN